MPPQVHDRWSNKRGSIAPLTLNNMTSKLSLISLLIFIVFSIAHAQDTLLRARFEATAPIFQSLQSLKQNPVAYPLLPLKQDLQLSIGLTQAQTPKDDLYNPFLGVKQTRQTLLVEGYNTDTLGHIVSGHASYTQGQDTQTSWTTMTDYQTFYPYLVVDSLSGTFHHQIYDIGGSYGQTLGRWSVGGGLNFKGQKSYQKADPRPLNSISKLEIQGGSNYALDHYNIGLFAHYTYEKLALYISDYTPNRTDYFFSLTGLGLFNYTLSENSYSFSRNYYNQNYTLGLQISNQDFGLKSQNFLLLLSASSDQIYNEDNQQRHPNEIERLKINLNADYLLTIQQRHKIQFRLQAQYTDSKGIENHYDTTYADKANTNIIVYEKTYSAVKHTLQQWSSHITIDYHYTYTPKSDLWVSILTGLEGYHEKDVYPSYHMGYKKIDLQGLLGWRHCFSSSWMSLQLCYRNSRSFQLSQQLPTTSKVTDGLINPYYDHLTGNYSQGTLSLVYGHRLSHTLMAQVHFEPYVVSSPYHTKGFTLRGTLIF